MRAHADKLLASAQHKATVDGDLKGAIEEYKKIVAGAGTNRALAAQALVRMAVCYQKVGDAEAKKIRRTRSRWRGHALEERSGLPEQAESRFARCGPETTRARFLRTAVICITPASRDPALPPEKTRRH